MADIPVIVTMKEVKDPNLLVRLLRALADRVLALGTRIDSLAKSINIPSFVSIRNALQSDGTHPLNISNLRGIVGDPQPAGLIRYTSVPNGLPLQSLRDTQMFAVKNGAVYDIYMVVGGNPNTAVLVLSGVAAGAHNVLSATHTDTLVGTVVRGDVIVGNSTPKWARLAKGTGNQVLRMDGTGTDPAWGAVADVALSSNIARLNNGGVSQTFTDALTFSSDLTLNAFLAALGGSLFPVRGLSNGTSTLTRVDNFVSVDVSGGTATVKFEASPATGAWHLISDDKENSGTNNITIDGNGKNIRGVATKTMNVNGATALFFYNGTQWTGKIF